jgi:hypothetical protein
MEITANPTGPQLHAPAAAPIIEPKIPPPIFCFELLRILILKIFIGITNADNAESITIRTKPNSLPEGIWLTTYGSRKIYSDNINNPINIGTKMPIAKITYLKLENTSLIVCTI